MKLLLALTLMMSSISLFAAIKTYQVTGPVLEMTDSTITVEKGKEKWEISKDATLKINGELKVGSKVTIQYFMTAKEIDVKEDKKTDKKSKK